MVSLLNVNVWFGVKIFKKWCSTICQFIGLWRQSDTEPYALISDPQFLDVWLNLDRKGQGNWNKSHVDFDR